ncbi:hypothetical protein LCGC14_2941500 [marine sediment metagenome]|uniref:Uncharacterized protein n=1 Tax=marine sediment metagenome TaxID=412755 RepID=A0A0F8XHT1_9ZZZZ
MGVPQVYRKTPEKAIVTFDFTQLATNRAVILLSGFVSETSGGLNYHLTSDETVYSSLIETTLVGTGPVTNLDFDLPEFNAPITINGDAIVSFTARGGAESGTTSNTSAVVTIRKWDGSTETDLVAVTTPTIAATSSTSINELFTIPLTIPKTPFKKGETLRLTIVLTTTRTSGGNNVSQSLGHDPRNRDGTIIVPSTDDPDTITKLNFYAPFEIDI